jgi:hypothetical protein
MSPGPLRPGEPPLKRECRPRPVQAVRCRLRGSEWFSDPLWPGVRRLMKGQAGACVVGGYTPGNLVAARV